MSWKFWQREKSEAEVSLERLQQASQSSVQVGDVARGPTSFEMRPDDVQVIEGRGIVINGLITFGQIHVGESVTVRNGDGSEVTVNVDGMEHNRQLVQSAEAGQEVGLMLGQAAADQISSPLKVSSFA